MSRQTHGLEVFVHLGYRLMPTEGRKFGEVAPLYAVATGHDYQLDQRCETVGRLLSRGYITEDVHIDKPHRG